MRRGRGDVARAGRKCGWLTVTEVGRAAIIKRFVPAKLEARQALADMVQGTSRRLYLTKAQELDR
jgi:hypothetical protein